MPFCSSLPAWAQAAETPGPNEGWLWSLVLALIVLIFTLASAALPLAATRQWRGAWRKAALAPLVALAVWVGLILLFRWFEPDSHRLWPLEIFAWAMLNMIYMVAIMTSKRTFDKADQEAGQ